MIRFDTLPPEVMQAMCTPMHQILPSSAISSSPYPASSHSSYTGALYLGSLAAAQDPALLREHGVSHIVQVLDAPWAPAGLTEREGFSTYKIEVGDEVGVDLRPYLEGVCANIERALRAGRSVLVHCQQGVSRSASIVIAYLIRYHAMSYDAALTLVRRKRACIKPNAGFVRALQEWEVLLRSGGGGGVMAGGSRPVVGRRFTS